MSKQEIIELFAKAIINHHGFGSNEQVGFSCFIPDKPPFPPNEGLFLWNFSRSFRRFETQIQKYHTDPRIHRMQKMLDISESDYKWIMIELVDHYLQQLQSTGIFGTIGKSIYLFNLQPMNNLGANFELVIKKPQYLKN